MKRFVLCLCVLCALSMNLVAFAAGIDGGVAGETATNTFTETVPANSQGSQSSTSREDFNPYDPEDVLGIKGGDYSADYIGDRLKEKGMDIVYILKIVGRYVCLGAFIVCCALILIGIIGNPRIVARSAIGALIAGVMYGAITCGEQIVQLIAAWSAL